MKTAPCAPFIGVLFVCPRPAKIVFASAGVSVVFGIVAGLGLSFALKQLIAQWVENASTNPLILFAASLLLLGVAALACLVPARRASAVDPMTALRSE